MRLLVMKFGGTSVGSARALNNAIRLVADVTEIQPFVVVSALSGVTDLLVALGEAIEKGDRFQVELIQLRLLTRHRDLAEEVLPPAERFSYYEHFYADFGKLERLTRTLVGSRKLSRADRDFLLAFGERFSAVLFTMALRTLTKRAHWCDAHNLVITDNHHGEAKPDRQKSQAALQRWAFPLLASDRIVVTQGFVGATAGGKVSTLGRGGSDYSATFLASILPAKAVQIWTDVNGVYTSDPKLDGNAIHLSHLALDEAYRLALAGAKVIYPPCLLPLSGTGISLSILNTLDPSGPHTLITDDSASPSHGATPRAALIGG